METLHVRASPLNNEVPDAKTRTRGGRSPKRKGNGFEREVVAVLQELGLAAERVPLSGSVKTSTAEKSSCTIAVSALRGRRSGAPRLCRCRVRGKALKE
jgi:hypothetical protein